MARLRGEGLGMGMALGTAAVVRMRGGVPLMPEVPDRIAQMLASRRLSETPEVVLVAPDYATALALSGSLGWGKVVGITAERAGAEPVTPPFPAVVNVPGLMNAVADDMLMLVDARNGVVLADPDPVYLGQYTSEHAHMTPRHRYHLEGEHLPAQTRDGRTLQVLAAVRTTDEIAVALEQGADALYVPFDCPLLPLFADEATLRRGLQTLIELAAGKSLFLSDSGSLPLLFLLEAGAQADITLVVPPQEDLEGLGLAERAEALAAAQEVCLEQEVAFRLPRLGVDSADPRAPEGERWESVSAWMEALSERGATRLVLSWSEGPELKALLPHLSEIMAAAEANLLPVYATALPFEREDASVETSVWPLVGIGVTGLLVPPGEVQAIKSQIQDLFYQESRSAIWQLLAAL